MNLDDLRDQLRQFAAERDWEQFHTPKNLAMALSVEASELVEIFQWLTPQESAAVMESDEADHVREELADILIYLVRVADVLGVDLLAAGQSKVALNTERFPRANRTTLKAKTCRPDTTLTQFVEQLGDGSQAISPSAISADTADLKSPGMYSWWVDGVGARELTAGLEVEVQPGLLYAGSAGATRWPSGKRSQNTLLARIQGMHLGGSHEFSTFRRSLGSALARAWGADAIDEDRLTVWMLKHLKVRLVPGLDADSLSEMERSALEQLNPQFNLQHMPPTELRHALSILRREVVHGDPEAPAMLARDE